MTHDIKSLRSGSAQSSKLRKLGAQGSLSAARRAECAPRKEYASGGTVGPSITGGSAQPRGRTAGKKSGSKGKKKAGTTTVNIALVTGDGGKGGAPGGPMPAGGPAGPGGPPMPPGHPGGPPGGPPLPPGPPMRASGGSVKAEDLAKDKQMAKPFGKGGKC